MVVGFADSAAFIGAVKELAGEGTGINVVDKAAQVQRLSAVFLYQMCIGRYLNMRQRFTVRHNHAFVETTRSGREMVACCTGAEHSEGAPGAEQHQPAASGNAF